MSKITENISTISKEIASYKATLIAVSKTKPIEDLQEAFDGGQIHFGENKVQEMVSKFETLPKAIKWHMIGHLQRNKVKQIVPFVHLIHGVDSERLLLAIDKEAKKINRQVHCLLQVHIAKEESKFGFDVDELMELIKSAQFEELKHIKIVGLMGMATNTKNKEVIKGEFTQLKETFEKIKTEIGEKDNLDMKEVSMGMSGDYMVALKCGSTMIRVGSAIFGERNYA